MLELKRMPSPPLVEHGFIGLNTHQWRIKSEALSSIISLAIATCMILWIASQTGVWPKHGIVARTESERKQALFALQIFDRRTHLFRVMADGVLWSTLEGRHMTNICNEWLTTTPKVHWISHRAITSYFIYLGTVTWLLALMMYGCSSRSKVIIGRTDRIALDLCNGRFGKGEFGIEHSWCQCQCPG